MWTFIGHLIVISHNIKKGEVKKNTDYVVTVAPVKGWDTLGSK